MLIRHQKENLVNNLCNNEEENRNKKDVDENIDDEEFDEGVDNSKSEDYDPYDCENEDLLNYDNFNFEDNQQKPNASNSLKNENNANRREPTSQVSSSKLNKKVDTPILYSELARKDGYDFSSLSKADQSMTKSLYISENAMSDFALANARITSELSGIFKYDWGVPSDGRYIGYIVNCSPSSKNPNNYIMQILLNDSDVRSFSFKQSSMDPVFCAIQQSGFATGGNIFREADYSCLVNSLVLFDVFNRITSTGICFSNIQYMKFLAPVHEAVLLDMVEIMAKQSKL